MKTKNESKTFRKAVNVKGCAERRGRGNDEFCTRAGPRTYMTYAHVRPYRGHRIVCIVIYGVHASTGTVDAHKS